jgi:hypothetical protein
MRIPPTRCGTVAILMALLLSVSVVQASAQDSGASTGRLADAVAIIAYSADAEAASFAEALATALGAELSGIGLEYGRMPSGGPSSIGSPAASTAAAGASILGGDADDASLATSVFSDGTRWAALLRCSVDNKRLLWRVSVYDGIDGALVASESRSAFAGLSVMPELEASAARIALELDSLRNRVLPAAFIDYRIRLLSPDEEARVDIGSGPDARMAGSIEGGQLVMPFVAFVADQPITLQVSRDAFWPRTVEIKPGVSDLALELKPLMLRSRHALSIGMGWNRLFGVSLDYRFYILEDALFLRAGNHIWLQGDSSADALPLVHDEARLGLGAYLLRPHDARLRIAAGSGVAGIATLMFPDALVKKTYLDLALDALWFSLEWHWPRMAVYMEERVTYVLATDTGLLRAGWLEPGNSPVALSAGVMFKWP